MKPKVLRIQAAMVLSALLLAAVALTLYARWPNREPVYQGKPLSHWMRTLSSANETQENRLALQALRKAGDRALPVLLRMLQADDTWMNRQMLQLQEHYQLQIDYLSSTDWNNRALLAFIYLRESASNAVPALIEMLSDTHSDAHQENAARALCCIGPAAKSAIPALLKTARSTNEAVCLESIIALRDVRPPADLVVPLLVDALRRHHTAVQNAASGILLNYGPSVAASATPGLVEVLRNGDKNARFFAAGCLLPLDREVALRAHMDTRVLHTGRGDLEAEYKKLLSQY